MNRKRYIAYGGQQPVNPPAPPTASSSMPTPPGARKDGVA